MEAFSNEIIKGKSASPKMRALLNKEKLQARKRVIERGIVHFRADSEFMEALLIASDAQKTAPGTLCRKVVWEYLQSLNGEQKTSADITTGASSMGLTIRDQELPTVFEVDPTVADLKKFIHEELEALKQAINGSAQQEP